MTGFFSFVRWAVRVAVEGTRVEEEEVGESIPVPIWSTEEAEMEEGAGEGLGLSFCRGKSGKAGAGRSGFIIRGCGAMIDKPVDGTAMPTGVGVGGGVVDCEWLVVSSSSSNSSSSKEGIWLAGAAVVADVGGWKEDGSNTDREAGPSVRFMAPTPPRELIAPLPLDDVPTWYASLPIIWEIFLHLRSFR
jgi:hypothetical protein